MDKDTDVDVAMEAAAKRHLTRKELKKKAVVLECYRDFWRRSRRPICALDEAEAYLVRAADIVIRVKGLVTPEGDTGSPDGTKVKRAKSEDDIEKAVLECVNHAASRGNSAEMLWDLEQCPSADPEGFVRGLVHATLRDADKYMFPTLDEAYVDRFIAVYDKEHPLGSVIEDDDVLLELEAVLAGMQKTTQNLSDVDLPKEDLRDIVKSLRDIDEKLAGFLPKAKKPEPEAEESQSQQEEEVPEQSEPAPAPKKIIADSTPVTVEKCDTPTAMSDGQEQAKPEQEPAEEKKKEEETDEEQPDTVTRQDSCLLKINTISNEMTALKPKVEDIEKEVSALTEQELSKDPLKGMEKVESLEKPARALSEQLMRALLSLDALSASEETRPLRRNQVIEVQQLLDRMDQVTNKLHYFSSALTKNPVIVEKRKRESEASLAAHQDPLPAIKKAEEEQKEAEAKKEAEIKQEQEKAREAAAAAEKEGGGGEEEEEEEEGEEEEQQEDPDEVLLNKMRPLWKELRLRPQFDGQEQREAYVLTAMIPGLNRDEIVVKPDYDNDEIIVSGVRVPTLEEFKKMLHKISVLQAAKRINIRNESDLKVALFHLCRDRFGTFEERFSLPEDAIVNKVYATYNGGRLGIVIPRNPRRRQYRQYPSDYGMPSLYGGPRGGFGGFPGFF